MPALLSLIKSRSREFRFLVRRKFSLFRGLRIARNRLIHRQNLGRGGPRKRWDREFSRLTGNLPHPRGGGPGYSRAFA